MVNRDTRALDDPVRSSLRGHHAHLARRFGAALTFPPAVATFSAIAADPGPQEWTDLARLLGSGEFADMFSSPAIPPPDWEPVFELEGRQMIYTGRRPDHDDDVIELGPDSVPEMLALAERAKPGPFWTRTRELGTYLGIREHGELVAMAGERLRPAGWTEISAVCTAPEARGRGHAARLVRALIARITARGDRPFLHVAEDNTGAMALYEGLGFDTRKKVTFRGFRTP
ncbi:FR47-like protein [Saccharopolyspora antimicrobica]|uniref:FR47-like protein n=1 Tax=Saccharopolyspora antimicrobica TaxID=455193 RepID=A0A1I4RB25_9PSEU|nr:GNAT family N-acetyltransferase [Saccharopolyspora antimicrobica]RKT88087.1 FR47-like protein [Saccharopolyspora antimicrobica]SFM49405.1 FR47-like protein [Saccharopolyspora antimicrobica]